jgi:hypothetical protein
MHWVVDQLISEVLYGRESDDGCCKQGAESWGPLGCYARYGSLSLPGCWKQNSFNFLCTHAVAGQKNEMETQKKCLVVMHDDYGYAWRKCTKMTCRCTGWQQILLNYFRSEMNCEDESKRDPGTS